MLNIIKWLDKGFAFRGRNGVGKCNGVEVLRTHPQSVMLSPITSVGSISSSCFIEVPADLIPDLIERLRSSVPELETL